MTTLTLPSATVEVLERPLTAEQYLNQDDVAEHGTITRNVSLDLQLLVERAYDDLVDHIAEQVVSELGEEWQLHSYRLLGVDPRQDGTSEHGCHGIFAVTVYPDLWPTS